MFSVGEQKNFSRPDPVQVPADEVVRLHIYHSDQGRPNEVVRTINISPTGNMLLSKTLITGKRLCIEFTVKPMVRNSTQED